MAPPSPLPLPDSFPPRTMFFSSWDDRYFCGIPGKGFFALTFVGLVPVSRDALPLETFPMDEAAFRDVAASLRATASKP